MKAVVIEPLEARQLFSASPVAPSAATPITLKAGTFKGSSVSTKGFTTRLTIKLGKQLASGTILGTFYYLEGFTFQMHLRLGADNTFHATISNGTFSGTLIAGEITTADKDTIIDLSARYTFSNGKGSGDSGTFLVRS